MTEIKGIPVEDIRQAMRDVLRIVHRQREEIALLIKERDDLIDDLDTLIGHVEALTANA